MAHIQGRKISAVINDTQPSLDATYSSKKIDELTSALALKTDIPDVSGFDDHLNDDVRHITAAERSRWNNAAGGGGALKQGIPGTYVQGVDFTDLQTFFTENINNRVFTDRVFITVNQNNDAPLLIENVIMSIKGTEQYTLDITVGSMANPLKLATTLDINNFTGYLTFRGGIIANTCNFDHSHIIYLTGGSWQLLSGGTFLLVNSLLVYAMATIGNRQQIATKTHSACRIMQAGTVNLLLTNNGIVYIDSGVTGTIDINSDSGIIRDMRANAPLNTFAMRTNALDTAFVGNIEYNLDTLNMTFTDILDYIMTNSAKYINARIRITCDSKERPSGIYGGPTQNLTTQKNFTVPPGVVSLNIGEGWARLDSNMTINEINYIFTGNRVVIFGHRNFSFIVEAPAGGGGWYCDVCDRVAFNNSVSPFATLNVTNCNRLEFDNCYLPVGNAYFVLRYCSHVIITNSIINNGRTNIQNNIITIDEYTTGDFNIVETTRDNFIIRDGNAEVR